MRALGETRRSLGGGESLGEGEKPDIINTSVRTKKTPAIVAGV
jgi:hypothetical protein